MLLGSPRPRKARLDSMSMNWPISKEVCTIMGVMVLGRTCRQSMRLFLAPSARAAMIYSRSLADSTGLLALSAGLSVLDPARSESLRTTGRAGTGRCPRGSGESDIERAQIRLNAHPLPNPPPCQGGGSQSLPLGKGEI
jgi:hypothetical protein